MTGQYHPNTYVPDSAADLCHRGWPHCLFVLQAVTTTMPMPGFIRQNIYGEVASAKPHGFNN